MSICIQMINLMGNIFILIGPYEKYLIKSTEKIGTKIAFLLSTQQKNDIDELAIERFKSDFEERDLL